MHRAHGGEALASEAVRLAARTRFRFRAGEPALQLGTAGTRVAVHALEGARAALPMGEEGADADAGGGRGAQTLVGREAETHKLLALIETARKGAAQVAVLTGGAGARPGHLHLTSETHRWPAFGAAASRCCRGGAPPAMEPIA